MEEKGGRRERRMTARTKGRSPPPLLHGVAASTKKRQCQIPTLRAEECQERNLDGKTELATLLQKVTSRGYIISFLQSKATTRVNISVLIVRERFGETGRWRRRGTRGRRTIFIQNSGGIHGETRAPPAGEKDGGDDAAGGHASLGPSIPPPHFCLHLSNPPIIHIKFHSLDPPGAREC